MKRTLIRFLSLAILLCVLALLCLSARQEITGSAAALAAVAAVPLRPRRPKKMPRSHPRVAHFMPYLRGDSMRAIWLAVRHGYRFIDQNVQKDAEGERWVIHWGRFRKQWTWQWTGEYVGTGRLRREKRVRVRYHHNFLRQLSTEQVSRLRSRRIGGTRPRKLRDHMAECARRRIILCSEFKYTPNREEWAEIARDAAQTGVTMIVMRLSNVSGGIVGAFHCLSWAVEVGFAAALLPRGRKPVDWETKWVPLGIQKWGYWRRTGQ
jgi:hypothetical protein